MLGSFLYIVAIFLVFVLVYYSFNKPSQFLYHLMLIKPFIDLTVNVPLIGSLNALQISGGIIFIITGFLYIRKYSSINHANHFLIWIFLGIQIISVIIASFNEDQSFLNFLDYLLRLFEGYFIYFCSRQILLNENSRKKFYKMVWLTTFSVSIITILSYWSGNYNIDITRGVVRVGGLFNDPGSPSYITVISLIFGTLYREFSNKKKISLNLLYLFNIFASSYVMLITVTKSAFLMLLVFIILWWGFHKKKILLVIPLIIISGYVAYSEISTVQKRLEYEIKFIEERSEKAAISMGTGRYGRWERVLKTYSDDFTFTQKILGSSKNYNAHNQFIAYLMQVGIIGLALFLGIIFRFYFKLIKLYKTNKNKEIFMVIVILSTFLTLGLSGHPFDWTTIIWYLMIMLGLVNVKSFRYSTA